MPAFGSAHRRWSRFVVKTVGTTAVAKSLQESLQGLASEATAWIARVLNYQGGMREDGGKPWSADKERPRGDKDKNIDSDSDNDSDRGDSQDYNRDDSNNNSDDDDPGTGGRAGSAATTATAGRGRAGVPRKKVPRGPGNGNGRASVDAAPTARKKGRPRKTAKGSVSNTRVNGSRGNSDKNDDGTHDVPGSVQQCVPSSWGANFAIRGDVDPSADTIVVTTHSWDPHPEPSLKVGQRLTVMLMNPFGGATMLHPSCMHASMMFSRIVGYRVFARNGRAFACVAQDETTNLVPSDVRELWKLKDMRDDIGAHWRERYGARLGLHETR